MALLTSLLSSLQLMLLTAGCCLPAISLCHICSAACSSCFRHQHHVLANCRGLGGEQQTGELDWGAELGYPLSAMKCVPAAEARGGLHIVEQSLWTAVPAYLRRVNAALLKHTGKELPISAVPLSFGSWMGGDRDGNPNVTAKVGASAAGADLSVFTGVYPAGAPMAEVAAKTAACCPTSRSIKLLHACTVGSAAQAKASCYL